MLLILKYSLTKFFVLVDSILITYLLFETFTYFSKLFNSGNRVNRTASENKTASVHRTASGPKPVNLTDLVKPNPQNLQSYESDKSQEMPPPPPVLESKSVKEPFKESLKTESLGLRNLSFYENKDFLKKSPFLSKTVSVLDFDSSVDCKIIDAIFPQKDEFSLADFCYYRKITVLGADYSKLQMPQFLDEIAEMQNSANTLILIEVQQETKAEKQLNIEQFYSSIDVAVNFRPSLFNSGLEFCQKMVELQCIYDKIIWLHTSEIQDHPTITPTQNQESHLPKNELLAIMDDLDLDF